MPDINELINDIADSEVGADAREPLIQTFSAINEDASADIEEYINDIQNAVYGPEVLNAICDGMRAIANVGGGSGGESFWTHSYPDSSIPEYTGDWTDENGEEVDD